MAPWRPGRFLFRAGGAGIIGLYGLGLFRYRQLKQPRELPQVPVIRKDAKVTGIELVTNEATNISLAPTNRQNPKAFDKMPALYSPDGEDWLTPRLWRPCLVTSSTDQPTMWHLLDEHRHAWSSLRRWLSWSSPPSIRSGDSVSIRMVLPSYRYTASDDLRHLLFIAGGDGIGTIYHFAQAILSNPFDKTRIVVIWDGTQSKTTKLVTPFRKRSEGTLSESKFSETTTEVDTLLGKMPMRVTTLQAALVDLELKHPDRLKIVFPGSDPKAASLSPPSSDFSRDIPKTGDIEQTVVQKAVSRLEKKRIWGDIRGTKVWLCGPTEMVESVAGERGILSQLGVTAGQIYRFPLFI